MQQQRQESRDTRTAPALLEGLAAPPEKPAKAMRVYEIAKEVGVEAKDLVTKVRSLGISVANHMSRVEPEDVVRVRRAVEKERQADLLTGLDLRPGLHPFAIRADAGRVAAHEVHLQLGELVVRNGDVGELAEAGGDAVDHATAVDDAGHDGAGGEHPRARRAGDRHGAARDGDRMYVGKRQRATVDFEWRGGCHGRGSRDER